MDEGGVDAAVSHSPALDLNSTSLAFRRSGIIPVASRSWVHMTFSSNLRTGGVGQHLPLRGGLSTGSCAPIADPCAPLWRRARPFTPSECRSEPWRPDLTTP